MPDPSPAPDPTDPEPSAGVDHRPLRADQLGTGPGDEGDGLAAQIEARHRASAEDARAQAPNRLAAAAKAVAHLKAEVAQPDAADGPGATPVAGAGPSNTERPAPPPGGLLPPPPPSAPGPAPDGTAPPGTRPGSTPPNVPVPAGGPARAVTSALATVATAPAARPPVSSSTPLFELRPSALGGDVDQLGDTLLVYVDRLEHRDRHGRLRRRMPVRDIADVEVQRRLTGCTFTVRSRAGVDLVLKGVRADVAEEGRRTILDHLPPNRAASSGPPPFDEAGLLRKLVDLYRAGVLSEAELAAKTDVVARLARAEVGGRAPRPEGPGTAGAPGPQRPTRPGPG